MRRLVSRLTYANIVSSLALFLVLTGGTAVALTGRNTVFSDDITNNEVRSADVRNDNLSGGGLASADIRPNALKGSDVSDNSLTGNDVAGLTGGDVNDNSLTGADVADASLTGNDVGGLTGADVTDDSLGGSDVDESTFDPVPSAQNAFRLDNLDSEDFARGDRLQISGGGAPTVLTGNLALTATNAGTRDFGDFRIEGTGTQNQFRVCNEFTVQRPFVIYTGGGSAATGSTRQQIEVAAGSCSAGISTGGDKSDFQVYGSRAVVFAQSQICCLYGFYALQF